MQYYRSPANIVKIEIKGTKVLIYDSKYWLQGIEAVHVLVKDKAKKKEWLKQIKKMSEKEIANDLTKDLKKLGLTLSSEVINE